MCIGEVRVCNEINSRYLKADFWCRGALSRERPKCQNGACDRDLENEVTV